MRISDWSSDVCSSDLAPMTPEFALKLGWAAGRVFGRGAPGARVVVGKDTRRSGYMFESALEAGFAAADRKSVVLGQGVSGRVGLGGRRTIKKNSVVTRVVSVVRM